MPPGDIEDSEREKGGAGQPCARCSDCLNLAPDNWCSALKRTVPGTRHIRKCSLFELGEPDPAPERPGKPQHPDLVQCVSCEYFGGWGLCEAGVSDFGGELASRIWRACSHHIPAEPIGTCSTCRHLMKQVCIVSGFPVTCPDSPTSCQNYLSFENIKVL